MSTLTTPYQIYNPPAPLCPPAPKFLQALKDLGDVDEEAISEAHLRLEYGTLQQQVTVMPLVM